MSRPNAPLHLAHRFDSAMLEEPVVYAPGERELAAECCRRCNPESEAEEIIDMLGLRDAAQ